MPDKKHGSSPKNIKLNDKENDIQTSNYNKETKELPTEIIDAINNHDLTEVQWSLLSLIIAMLSNNIDKDERRIGFDYIFGDKFGHMGFNV